MSEPQPQDWRTLEAGNQLDFIVAFKLLGVNLPREIFDRNKAFYEPWVETKHGYRLDTSRATPHFSTDLNTAFLLFSTEPGLEWNLFSEDGGRITCELGSWDIEPGEIYQGEQATEKTAALAICKAWLKWQERTDHAAPELKELK